MYIYTHTDIYIYMFIFIKEPQKRSALWGAGTPRTTLLAGPSGGTPDDRFPFVSVGRCPAPPTASRGFLGFRVENLGFRV